MPDLGPYALVVALAYGATVIALALLIGATWRKARHSKRRLSEAEARK